MFVMYECLMNGRDVMNVCYVWMLVMNVRCECWMLNVEWPGECWMVNVEWWMLNGEWLNGECWMVVNGWMVEWLNGKWWMAINECCEWWWMAMNEWHEWLGWMVHIGSAFNQIAKITWIVAWIVFWMVAQLIKHFFKTKPFRVGVVGFFDAFV